MEDTEFLKALLAEMNANMKRNQERMEAKIDVNRKADQEKADADRQHIQEMIRTNQEKACRNTLHALCGLFSMRPSDI
jgi:hypothetical protein